MVSVKLCIFVWGILNYRKNNVLCPTFACHYIHRVSNMPLQLFLGKAIQSEQRKISTHRAVS